MKKAINLIIMYFVFLIGGILVGTLFYSFYLSVTNFVAGQKMDLWDIDIIMKSLFFVSIAMCFLIFPLLSFYRIRHLGGVSQTITYIILVVLTVVVVFPSTIQLKTKYYEKFPQGSRISHLSGGYFRQSGDKIYYFTKDFISNPVTGEDTTTVVIDTSENGSVSIEKIKDTPDFVLYEAASPCKEILAKNAFSGAMGSGKSGITILVEKAEESYKKGISFALGMVAVFLVFASVYAVTSFFQWKLLNVFLLIINSVICIFTMGFYALPASNSVKAALESNRLMEWMHRYVDDPSLLCFYVIFSLIMIIVGIVSFAVKKHKKKA